jgi:UDP-glucose 4-epimerase
MGKNVVVLDDLSGGFLENIPAGCEFVRESVNDAPAMRGVFKFYKFTHIYHLAAYAAEGLSHFIRRFNYTNNLLGSVNLINCAVNYGSKCFVFTSSIAVYGRGQLPFTEETTPHPEDPYGISKYAVELDLANAFEMFGLQSVIFRPHNVYGPGQNIGDKYRNVVGIFMNQILKGEPLIIFGNGTQTRAFSYIDDVAIPIAHAGFVPECYGQTFNIGADLPYCVLDLAAACGVAMDVPFSNVILNPARNEVQHAYSCHAKAREYFREWITDVPLKEGLALMAAWVKRHGARSTVPFADTEISKNLPECWR